MNRLPFMARIVIVILLTLALSEVSPELVNAILFLVLIGILLSQYKTYSGFLNNLIGG